MTDMMKQHCLPVKKLLRAFVLRTDSRYEQGGGGRVVKFQTAFREQRFLLLFIFCFVSLLCKYVL